MWFNIPLCVKSIEAQVFNVKKEIEVEAMSLATVLHPNVVQVIGCTVKTWGTCEWHDKTCDE